METASPEQGPDFIAKHVSFIMLKPENADKAVLFPHILKNYGFHSEVYEKELNKDDIQKMYPDIENWEEWVREATFDHLQGKRVTLLLLNADNGVVPHTNVLDEVLRIRGDKTSPLVCEPHTLRHVFRGEEKKYNGADGAEKSYWENGVHCPRDPQELMLNLEIFGLADRARELARAKQ